MSTKRANPFTEDFIPQSKIHVGLKQFNNNKDRLNSVYEKTLKLLYKGAKRIPECDSSNNNNDPECTKKDKMKQLFIGKDGSLQRAGQLVSSNKLEANKCCCGSMMESECGYCERAVCGACAPSCSACRRPHCPRCALPHTTLCLTCHH